MRELYKAEFTGDIKVEALQPTGYSVQFYLKDQYNPFLTISSDGEQFLNYVKEQLRVSALNRTKHFTLFKLYNER